MLLIERQVVDAKLLEKETTGLPDGVLLRVTYPVCNIGERNHNKRVYEKRLWEAVHANPDIKEKLATKTLFGHAEHPETVKSSVERVSHAITKSWVDESAGKLKQTFEVFDTPFGRIVSTLLRAGCGLGVSTRAEGELEEAKDEQGPYMRVVPEKYRYVTTDFTADPSTFGAYPEDIQKTLVPIVKQGLESKKIDAPFARVLLETMKTPEAVALMESIKETPMTEASKTPEKVAETKGTEPVKKEGEQAPAPVSEKKETEQPAPVKVEEKKVNEDSDFDDLVKRLEVCFSTWGDDKKIRVKAITESIGIPAAKEMRQTRIALAEANAELEILRMVDAERSIEMEKQTESHKKALESLKTELTEAGEKAKLPFGEKLMEAAKIKMDEKITAIKTESEKALAEANAATAKVVKEAADLKSANAKLTEQVKTLTTELTTIKESVKKAGIKNFVKGILEHSKLNVSRQQRALLEACGTEQEVLAKLSELRDNLCENALHSGAIKEKDVKQQAAPDPVRDRVGKVFEGM